MNCNQKVSDVDPEASEGKSGEEKHHIRLEQDTTYPTAPGEPLSNNSSLRWQQSY